jgi:hypothetical protein
MRILKKHKAPLPAVPARTKGWEDRLYETLDAINGEPIAWGRYDCITRVADVCLAMTGVDPMADFRGEYSTEAEAAKLIVARGCEDVAGLLAQAFPEVPPLMARRGDCGVVYGPDGVPAAVVIEGATASGAGSVRVSVTRVARAFRVGA